MRFDRCGVDIIRDKVVKITNNKKINNSAQRHRHQRLQKQQMIPCFVVLPLFIECKSQDS